MDKVKARIDEDGSLWLVRAGELKQQMCHKVTPNGMITCSDSCPLFDGPYQKENTAHKRYDPAISICEGVVWTFPYDTIEDLRVKS